MPGLIAVVVVVAIVLIILFMRRSPKGLQEQEVADLRAKHPEDIAFMEETLGIDVNAQLDYVKAMLYLQESQGVSFREQFNSNEEVALSFWQGVAQSYLEDGNHARAAECFEKALKIAADGEAPQPEMAAAIRCGLGVSTCELGAYDRAIELFEKSLAYHEETGQMTRPEVAMLLHNIGWAYHGKGDEMKARAYYERALELCERIDHSEGMEMVAEKLQKLR